MKKLSPLVLTAALALLGAAQAAVKLPDVNCLTDKSNARCKYTSSAIGKTGSGLPFDLGGYIFMRSGFVDPASNAVYVPVDFGTQEDNKGVIFKVDLATGNRTIVSGFDGEEWKGKGVEYVDAQGQKQMAYDLGRIEVVRPGPDSNSLLAFVDKGLQIRTEVFKIDLKTGDRTLVWASKVYDDSAKDGPTSIRTIEKERFNHGSDTLCKGGDGRVGLKPVETFETDGKNIYLFMQNAPAGTGIGLIKVPVTGGACTWISQYWPDGSNVVGSGSTINTLMPLVFASALVGDEFMAVNGPVPGGNTLFAINVKDGSRRTVSVLNTTPARTKGAGDSAIGRSGRMAVTTDGLAATIRRDMDDDSFEPVLVKLSTGDRTASGAKGGSLAQGRDSRSNIVAAIPGTHKFVVAFGPALHIWDADTGNSYLLSQ